MEFADLLRQYMEKNNISCRKAAMECKVDRTSIARYMNGSRRPRDLETVRRIATGIGMQEEEAMLLFEAYEQNEDKSKGDILYQFVEDLFAGKVETVTGRIYNKEVLFPKKDGKKNYKLSSKKEILACLTDLTRNAKSVRFHMGVDSVEVLNVLLRNCAGRSECKLEQLIEVGPAFEKGRRLRMILEQNVALLLSDASYRILYHRYWSREKFIWGYAWINCILTDRGIVLFDEKMSEGICSYDSRYCSYYNRKFQSMCEGGRFYTGNAQIEEVLGHMQPQWSAVHESSGIEFVQYEGIGTVYVKLHDKEEHMFAVGEEQLRDKMQKVVQDHEKEK